jgi:hypothetical protein
MSSFVERRRALIAAEDAERRVAEQRAEASRSKNPSEYGPRRREVIKGIELIVSALVELSTSPEILVLAPRAAAIVKALKPVPPGSSFSGPYMFGIPDRIRKGKLRSIAQEPGNNCGAWSMGAQALSSYVAGPTGAIYLADNQSLVKPFSHDSRGIQIDRGTVWRPEVVDLGLMDARADTYDMTITGLANIANRYDLPDIDF